MQNNWLARQRACICLAILITGLSVLLPVLISVHWSLLEKQTGKKNESIEERNSDQRENNFTVFFFSIYYKNFPYYPVTFWPCQSLDKSILSQNKSWWNFVSNSSTLEEQVTEAMDKIVSPTILNCVIETSSGESFALGFI